MARYAEGTEVPVQRTRNQIEALLARHGATSFGYAQSQQGAAIGFEIRGRRYRLEIPAPDPNDRKFTHVSVNQHRDRPRTRDETSKLVAAEWQRRWRVRLLMLTAVLEAVAEAADFKIEEVLMPWVVVAGDQTAGQWLEPQIEAFYAGGSPPALLPRNG